MKKNGDTLWGYHAVAEALRAGRRKIYGIYLDTGKKPGRRDQIAHAAKAASVAVHETTAQNLASLVGHHRHQGICAQVSAYPYCRFEDITGTGENPPFVLVLDQIVDPHNLGAMVRTAHCAGVDGIVVPKDRSAQPSATVSRISAGALEHARVAAVTNLVSALTDLKSKGVWIAGADRNGDTDIYTADLTGPLAVVIGGEEKGLRPLVKKHCDFTLSIPQSGPIGSLNASVAAAVILYETYRQRMRLTP